MFARILVLAATSALALATLTAVPAAAAPRAEGKQWRELNTTTGLTWAQVASVCPTDGATPCSGTVAGVDLTGWVWGTGRQVKRLLDDYWPGIATATPPVISGVDGIGPALAFFGDMSPTYFVSTTYSYGEYAGGWTATRNAKGKPVAAGASFSTRLTGTTTEGSLGISSVADQASPYRGVFLWQPAGSTP